MGKQFFILLLGFHLFQASAPAMNRYAVGVFYGTGMQCRQAMYNAQNACAREMERFVNTHQVTEPPYCGGDYCFCSYGAPARAVCPGKVRYDDGLSYEPQAQTIFNRFPGYGLNCQQAIYAALENMYSSTARATSVYAVRKFQLDDIWGCRCDGYRHAYCTGSITYHKLAATDPTPPTDPVPPVPDPIPLPDPNSPAPRPDPNPPADTSPPGGGFSGRSGDGI